MMRRRAIRQKTLKSVDCCADINKDALYPAEGIRPPQRKYANFLFLMVAHELEEMARRRAKTF